MDTFAHGVWSAIALSNQPRQTMAWGIAWGTLPDLVPFSTQVLLFPVYGFQRVGFPMVYPFTHSLVIFSIAVLIAALVLRRIPLAMLPWALHILVDIPGHQGFLTPFLFPLSDFRVMGWWSWLTPSMLLVNYTVIATVMIVLGMRRRRAQRVAGTP